jgi:hypothetical protein
MRLRRLLVLCAVLLACSGCGTVRQLAEGAVAEAHEGPFYAVPDPVPAGRPGEVLRSEPLPDAPAGAVAWRVLYHSTDVHGSDVVVSGTVIAPAAPAPPGGRPVVSWGHPTTGSAPRCAPSSGVDPFWLIEGLPDLLHAGYVVAATDYPGMGAPGPDSYLIGPSEGRSTLDAARAARALPAGANDQLLLWGHSQGGHAALFAAQEAATYAPDLRLLAVATAAPATDLVALLDADIGDVSGVTIGAYAFAAYADVYRDVPGATLDRILTPAGATATPAMAQLCLIGQNGELHRAATPLIGHYLGGDPGAVEPWATLLRQNTPGPGRLPVPLLVAQGDADTLVEPAITWRFADQQCAAGTPVTRVPVAGADHGDIAVKAVPTLLTWFDAVRADTLAAAGCTAPA